MEKVKLGIIGCGNFARFQMNNIVADSGYEMLVVCDSIADKAEAFRKDFDLSIAVTDYQEVLVNPDIEWTAKLLGIVVMTELLRRE